MGPFSGYQVGNRSKVPSMVNSNGIDTPEYAGLDAQDQLVADFQILFLHQAGRNQHAYPDPRPIYSSNYPAIGMRNLSASMPRFGKWLCPLPGMSR